MKSLVYTAPNSLVFQDSPDPVPGKEEAVIRVEAVGICGSDMHAYHGFDERRPAPLILGHEAAGRVMTGPMSGKRVAVNPLVTCNTCNFCLDGRQHLCRQREIASMPARPGAFAELLRMPDSNLVEIPESFDAAKAAMAEPLAVGYHAARLGERQLARPLALARIVILGGGAIGLSTALCLRLLGADDLSVAETNAARRATVERAGPFRTFTPGAPGEPEPSCADLVFDAVGADATRAAACRLAAPGSTIVHIGLLPGTGGIDIRKITLQEIKLVGSYCYTMLDFRETVSALVAGRLGSIDWIEQRPLAEGQAAFRDIDAGRVAAAKIVLRP